MKKPVKNIAFLLNNLDDPYVYEITQTADQVLQYIDSALWDFHDALDRPDSDAYRTNMVNNIEDAMYELAGLRDLCLDEDRIKRLDQQRLLLALEGTV
jgi:hypothetical protein